MRQDAVYLIRSSPRGGTPYNFRDSLDYAATHDETNKSRSTKGSDHLSVWGTISAVGGAFRQLAEPNVFFQFQYSKTLALNFKYSSSKNSCVFNIVPFVPIFVPRVCVLFKPFPLLRTNVRYSSPPPVRKENVRRTAPASAT